jgi:hypothetical protein
MLIENSRYVSCDCAHIWLSECGRIAWRRACSVWCRWCVRWGAAIVGSARVLVDVSRVFVNRLIPAAPVFSSCSTIAVYMEGFIVDLRELRSVWQPAARAHQAALPPNSTSRNHLAKLKFVRMWWSREGQWLGKTTVMNVRTSDASSQPPFFLAPGLLTTYQHLRVLSTDVLVPSVSHNTHSKRTIELYIPRSCTLPWRRLTRRLAPLVPGRCHSSLFQ